MSSREEVRWQGPEILDRVTRLLGRAQREFHGAERAADHLREGCSLLAQAAAELHTVSQTLPDVWVSEVLGLRRDLQAVTSRLGDLLIQVTTALNPGARSP